MDNLKISRMTVQDLEEISDILASDFDDFWPYNIFKSELTNPLSQYFVAKQDTEIVGFGGIWESIDDIHVTEIVVKKNKRNLGIGSMILEHLIKISYSLKPSSLTLEVRENNIPAIRLYTKHGFKEVGFRKHYYGYEKNAIIMTLYLNKNIFEEETNEKK